MMPNVLAGTVTVIALSVALGASSALAEGARETYDCVSTQRCDGAGLCEPADEAITFVVAPLSQDAQGGGTLTLSYGDETAQATRLSDIAPIVWSSGPGDVQSLMITGSAMFVWYWLDLNYGNSELTFLTCKVSR